MPANTQSPTLPDIALPADQHASHAATHAPAEHAEHAGAEHSPEAHPHKKHHKHKHDHGGHGDKWLVTYCDMITLLIAFFICILTFASKENGNKAHAKLRDSLIYGPGGSGAVGDPNAKPDSIVWRQVLASVSPQALGSSSAPHHSDPLMNANEQVLDLLDQSTETLLDDRFSFRVPLVVLMSDDKTISPAGNRLLSNIAFGIRQFSFDLIIQIDSPAAFPTAFRLSKRVVEIAGCPPSRTGISVSDGGARQRDSVRFLFISRQR